MYRNLNGNLRRRLPAFLKDFWAETVDMLLRVSAVFLQKITISEWHQNIYTTKIVFQPVPQKTEYSMAYLKMMMLD